MKYRFCLVMFLGVIAWDANCSAKETLGDDVVGSSQDFSVKLVEVEDLQLEVIVNSDTFSQASAINSLGSIIGTREVVGQNIAITSQKSFYFGEVGHKDMPLPDTFTNVEATGISDTDLVIGYATRPIGHPKGNLDAVIWDPKADTVKVLPRAEGDSACQAQSITSDGSIIAGYSTGPARLRPVIWVKDVDSNEWQVRVLPTKYDNNPYLMSGSLRITPDGTCLAGCCTEAFLPNGVIDSSLYVWTKDDQGDWKQRPLSADQIYVKGINNKREIVGVIRELSGRMLPCVFDAEGREIRLPLLPGDVNGEARGINVNSLIVGFSDDPHGPDGGPEPCRWTVKGEVVSVKLGASPYGTIHGVNDAGQMAGMATLVEVVGDPDGGSGEVTEKVLAFRTKKTKR